MLIDNKISRLLTGPYLFFGFIFLLGGISAIANGSWILAIILLFFTWFLFTSRSGVEINTDKDQFREYNKWFGLYKTGKWKPVHKYIGLTLVPLNRVYRTYSRSNRGNSTSGKEYYIYLVNKAKRPAIAIKKCKTHAEAQNKMDELAIWLHLPVYSVSHF